jgi:hypothetical protein
MGSKFLSEGNHATDFLALKSPWSSSGFEPANLGYNGKHVTTRQPRETVNIKKVADTIRELLKILKRMFLIPSMI